jgi:ABC-type branched-subunit amino acid transport system substrate-binding protein
MAGAGFDRIPDVLRLAGSAARGLYVATSEIPPDALDLTPEGKRFTSEFGTAADASFVINAAQATEVVLQAIARSDGTRASVLREIQATDIKDGILGSFRFDRYGDITPANVAIFRITGSSPPHLGLPSHFKGAVIARVETIPANLAG